MQNQGHNHDDPQGNSSNKQPHKGHIKAGAVVVIVFQLTFVLSNMF